MSNASKCRAAAARYEKLAELAVNAERRHAYRVLQRLWLDMATPAERFDRGDAAARDRIYEMLDIAARERRSVA